MKRYVAVLILVMFSVPSGSTRLYAQAPPQWLDSPPTSPAAVPACPAIGGWLLLYWGGAPGPISSVAFACSNDDVLWSRHGERWLGFSRTSPDASDNWTVETGEAAFLHGLTAPQPTAWTRDPVTGKWSFPGFIWDPASGRWVLALPSTTAPPAR